MVARAAVAVAIAPLVGGCAARSGGLIAAAPQAQSAAITWPERYSEGAEIALGEGSLGVTLNELCTTPETRLYEVKRSGAEAFLAKLEGPGFVFRWTAPPTAPQGVDENGEPLSGRLVAVASTDVGIKKDPSAADLSDFNDVIQTMFAAVRLRPVFIVGPQGRAPRGVCVVLPGLGGWTSVEAQFITLARRGWTVVGVMPDMMRSVRTQRRAMVLPHKGGDSASMATRVESEIADDAFVVEAVLRQLLREQPTLSDRPVVLAGSSLGALGLPAVGARLAAARSRDEAQAATPLPRVSAAVLIGGGVGLGELMCDSPLGRQWLALAGVDLETTDLESLRVGIDAGCSTAPERCLWSLDGRPVLLVDALFDAIVPRRSANRLWESLGEPARWSYPVGHIGLFFLISDAQWRQVIDWIDAVAAPAAATDASAS